MTYEANSRRLVTPGRPLQIEELRSIRVFPRQRHSADVGECRRFVAHTSDVIDV